MSKILRNVSSFVSCRRFRSKDQDCVLMDSLSIILLSCSLENQRHTESRNMLPSRMSNETRFPTLRTWEDEKVSSLDYVHF